MPTTRPSLHPGGGLHFPYMVFARTEASRTGHPLTFSGMPAPSEERLRDLGARQELDLTPPLEALPELEARIARTLGVSPAQVLVTSGASGALHLAAMAFFPGHEVVTETPSYEPFRALSSLYARASHAVPRRLEENWELPTERVAAQLASAGGPAHVFLCNPHNPTGRLTTPDGMRALADLANRSGGLLVSNEAYMLCAPPGERFHAARLAPHSLSLGSLTKAHGLGALRIGWLALGEALVEERERVADHLHLVAPDLPTMALRAGITLLAHETELCEPLRSVERESRPLIERWLASEPRVTGRMPDHGITVFAHVHGVDDTLALADALARDHDVGVVPGEYFGAPGFVRIGFGLPPDALERGLERLSHGLARLGATDA